MIRLPPQPLHDLDLVAASILEPEVLAGGTRISALLTSQGCGIPRDGDLTDIEIVHIERDYQFEFADDHRTFLARVSTLWSLTVSPGAALMKGCWVLASDCRLLIVAHTQS